MNIVFMGTPDFAAKSLESIYNAGHNVLAVITNPDRPKGRGMKMIMTPVKEYALQKNIPVYQPEKIKENTEILEILKNLNPDIICVVAYGKMLPKEILELPKNGCINVHASLLPKYRGAAPIQWAIINGEKKTGVATMYMDEGMDTGDVILTQEVEIDEDITTGELWNQLAGLGGKLLAETLEKIKNGTATRTKQGENFTHAPMLNKEMARINWEEKSAIEIKNLVRGLNPIMGAYVELDGKKLKFWKVDVIDIEEFLKTHQDFAEYGTRVKNLEPGTIVYIDEKEGMLIKAKDNLISVLEIQAENSKRMPISDFLRGNKINVGEIL